MIRVAIARLLVLSAIIGEKGEKEWGFDLREARVLVRKRRKEKSGGCRTRWGYIQMYLGDILEKQKW